MKNKFYFTFVIVVSLILIHSSLRAQIDLSVSSGSSETKPQSENFLWKTSFFTTHENLIYLDEMSLDDLKEYSKKMSIQDYTDLLKVFRSPMLPQWLISSGRRYHVSRFDEVYETRFFLRALVLVLYYEENYDQEKEFFKILDRFSKIIEGESFGLEAYFTDVYLDLMSALLNHKYKDRKNYKIAFNVINRIEGFDLSNLILYDQNEKEFGVVNFIKNGKTTSDVESLKIWNFVMMILERMPTERVSLMRPARVRELGLGFYTWKMQLVEALKDLYISRMEYQMSFEVNRVIEALKKHQSSLAPQLEPYTYDLLEYFLLDEAAKERAFFVGEVPFILTKKSSGFLIATKKFSSQNYIKVSQIETNRKFSDYEVDRALRLLSTDPEGVLSKYGYSALRIGSDEYNKFSDIKYITNVKRFGRSSLLLLGLGLKSCKSLF